MNETKNQSYRALLQARDDNATKIAEQQQEIFSLRAKREALNRIVARLSADGGRAVANLLEEADAQGVVIRELQEEVASLRASLEAIQRPSL